MLNTKQLGFDWPKQDRILSDCYELCGDVSILLDYERSINMQELI